MMSWNRLSDLLKALNGETRQKILLSLFRDGKERTVNQVAEEMGLGQSTASEHLTQMKRAGILTSRRMGKEVLYRPDREELLSQLRDLQQLVEECCPPEP
ncbi:ArsR/SmtB family transcription factor [Deinococcus roseus]|uniref:Transcriptional regulator n=1 Tax=Deinococcus roseus TaxID=392414 RepID=A0ABQ2D5L7_9DEIO|nr:metalloregulator ArsR/SmtB family transcription factor [Deinococcus roseus]GGJ47016.1 transcriptional regulator [Deinococcus roseus]